DVDFVIIVLAGSLEVEAELECVAPLDPGQAIRRRVDWTGGMRRIGSSAQVIKACNLGRRNAIGDQLSFRENVRIVQADGGAVQKVGLVHRDVNVIQTDGRQRLVHQRRAYRPNVIERVGLV